MKRKYQIGDALNQAVNEEVDYLIDSIKDKAIGTRIEGKYIQVLKKSSNFYIYIALGLPFENCAGILLY